MYAPFESDLRSTSSDVYQHEMPGGQYTNLKFQVYYLGVINLATLSFILSFISSFLPHSLTHSPTHPLTHSPTRSLAHSLTHYIIESLIQSFQMSLSLDSGTYSQCCHSVSTCNTTRSQVHDQEEMTHVSRSCQSCIACGCLASPPQLQIV